MRCVSAFMLLLLALLLLPVCMASSDVETSIIAEGVAAVVNGDLGRAEDEALNDAKRNAVEQAIGVFVKSETLGEDYQVVKETILTKSEGYITTWSKVEGSRKVETIEGNQLLKIKVSAKVGLTSLIDALSDIEEVYNAIQRPRIMVLVAETNLGKPTGDMPASSAAIIRTLQDRKFDVVDPTVVEQLKRKESVKAIMERGDVKAASLLAMDQGAEILVLGNAKSTITKAPYDLNEDVKTCSATLNARIVYADTGEILFTSKPTEGRGASFNSNEEAGVKALDDAGSRLITGDSQRFTSQVIARWAKEVQNGRVLRLATSDISYEEFNALKKAIREFRGHVDFVRENYESHKGTLDVRTKLSPDEFRERLMDIKVGRKSLDVDRTFGSVTSLSFR